MSSTVPTQLPPAAKAEILIEALPYIRRFWGRTVVIKYGGNAFAAPSPGESDDAGEEERATAGRGDGDPTLRRSPGLGPRAGQTALEAFATDVVIMRSVGIRPLVVHGGGPQIGALMRRLGKEATFRDGLRVTDAETLDIARMVLVGKVNRDIVSAINVHDPLAVGVSGEDAGLLVATARDPELGFVGDVHDVNPELLLRLLAEDLIPVVATIGSDRSGQAYNINADTAAAAIAAAVKAEKLVYLTDVEGIRARPDDPTSLLPTASADELEALIADGTITGGMVPKARACVTGVRAGVGHAHILDGRSAHALLLEIFTNRGIGTMVSS